MKYVSINELKKAVSLGAVFKFTAHEMKSSMFPPYWFITAESSDYEPITVVTARSETKNYKTVTTLINDLISIHGGESFDLRISPDRR